MLVDVLLNTEVGAFIPISRRLNRYTR